MEEFNESLDKEARYIMEVLENYNYKVLDFCRTRSAYKVCTSDGNMCLKKMKHGERKVRNGSILVEQLIKRGFNNLAKYKPTKTGGLFVKTKKNIFYSTEWIDGEECNLNDIDEAIKCVKLLAEFHLASSNINCRKLDIRNNLKNWPKIFNNNLSDLEKFSRTINKMEEPSEFDLFYRENITRFYERGQKAVNFLNNTEYYRLSKFANDNRTICHDSFYYQNIIKKEDKYYLIDLDSVMIDLHINDLGKLIRRLMYKKEYKWDFNKARKLIEAYDSVNPLSNNELQIMLSLIIFPHKFWKLGKKRYIRKKDWDEETYIKKLKKLIRYSEIEENFFAEYLDYSRNFYQNKF